MLTELESCSRDDRVVDTSGSSGLVQRDISARLPVDDFGEAV